MKKKSIIKLFLSLLTALLSLAFIIGIWKFVWDTDYLTPAWLVGTGLIGLIILGAFNKKKLLSILTK